MCYEIHLCSDTIGGGKYGGIDSHWKLEEKRKRKREKKHGKMRERED
jgi:hypothetical protein